jgi:hypothetical protein
MKTAFAPAIVALFLLSGVAFGDEAPKPTERPTAERVKPAKPVKVFILTGQSNMEGKAKLPVAEYQAEQPATRELYAPMRRDGKWAERDDVWIKFLDRHGKLTAGYGSPGCIGPELGFGWVVGDHYDAQVLLIKPAWGGRSLYRDFRPPSAGMPPEAVLDKMLADLRKKKPEATRADIEKPFGAAYREMLEEVSHTLDNLKTLLPAYEGQGYELDGLVWLQGWNDMIDATATAEYTSNLSHFIRDVRKDLKSADLPFVIGQMGVDGDHPNDHIVKFKQAEAAVMDVPEFKGNVALVKTDVFWDKEAEAVFKSGWREHKEQWDHVGSDYGYHYLGSPRTMLGMGRAFAQAMLDLRREKDKKEGKDAGGK